MRNFIFIIALSFFLTGCLEFDILVKVKPDGSGTIEQTVLVSRAVMSEIKEMAESIDAEKDKDKNKKEFNPIDNEKLLQEAKSMGKDVRFVRAKPISTSDQEGYIAYYEFKDINTLTINQNPSGRTPIAKEPDQKAVEEPVTFSFKRGTPATLTIHQPEKSLAPDSASNKPQESQPEANDTSGLNMMMDMMKGFRIAIAVQVEGKILDAQATYVDSNRVTLLEVDFDKLAHDRTHFVELTKQKPQTVEEAKKLLKEIPGIKVELLKNPTVRFQGK